MGFARSRSSSKRTRTILVLALTLLLAGVPTAALAEASSAGGVTRNGSPAVSFEIDATCLTAGGTTVTFTVHNNTNQTLRIANDFHLTLLEGVATARTGRGGIGNRILEQAFVLPVPSHAVIPPGGSSTFSVGLGEAAEGALGIDLSAGPYSVVAQVWFDGYTRPLTTAAAFEACPPPSQDNLDGGIVATFEVEGELFSVWVTNPATIEQILDLQAGLSTASIPNGRIHYGPGQANHNAPWSWHLDPVDIEMADTTIELCDAIPSDVEANLAEFVESVTRYCPWGAELVSVVDYR